MTDRDLNHSRLLDVHKWSDYPEVNSWVYRLWDDEVEAALKAIEEAKAEAEGRKDKKSSGGRKAKQTAREMFKVLLLDLYVSWLEDPEQLISVSRTDGDYKVNSRYNALFISDKLILVLDACIHTGLIEQHLGSEAAGKLTRVWPTERLRDYFLIAAFPDFMINTYEGRETVVLNAVELDTDDDLSDVDGRKDKKPTAIAYEDTDSPVIIPARELLADYNALLKETFVDLCNAEHPYVERQQWDKKTKQYVTRSVSLRHDNKFVRRIFYRGNWELGGRFHGGWWQLIPSELRQFVLIGDEATQEVDFSGFHVALSYGLEGLQPPSDPYMLSHVIDGFEKDQQRKDVKQLALTAINAKDRKTTFEAFRNDKNKEIAKARREAVAKDEPAPTQIKYTNELLNQLLDGFLEHNEPIRHYLCTDKGVELMALDGRITASIIKRFTEQDILVLTIHDSYIVAIQHERALEHYMRETCEQELGVKGFTIKPEKLTPNRATAMTRGPYSHDITLAIDAIDRFNEQTLRVEGYKDRLNKWTDFERRFGNGSECRSRRSRMKEPLGSVTTA